jgi:hypothetical protein
MSRPAIVLATALIVAIPPVLAAQQPNQLTPAEKAAGWRLLFDGKTLKGWKGLGYDSVPTAHWMVDGGAIRKIPSGKVPLQPDGQPLHGGDLMTVGDYTDFELSFEWKVAPGANSGVKYNVSEPYSLKYQPGHAALGFEYQIEDDSLGDDITLGTHRAAALYALIAANDRKRLKPVGQWNTARIVFRGNHGEHWLNGEKVVAFDLHTPQLDSLVALSKYHVYPGFADKRSGHIILQDHNDEAWYRSIKILVPGGGPPKR